MRKRLVSTVIASCMFISVTACSSNNTYYTTSPSDSVRSSIEDEISDALSRESESNVLPASASVNKLSTSVDFETVNGYKMKATLTLSDWISYQEYGDVLQAEWNKLNSSMDLPSLEQMGFYSNGSYSYFGDTLSMNWDEVYYSIGTFEIQNKTEGYSLSDTDTESLSVSIFSSFDTVSTPPISMLASCKSDELMNKGYVLPDFHTTRLERGSAAGTFSPLMSRDKWITTVVIAFGINKTPNAPLGNPPVNGISFYFDAVKKSNSITPRVFEMSSQPSNTSATTDSTTIPDGTYPSTEEVPEIALPNRVEDDYKDLFDFMRSVIGKDPVEAENMVAEYFNISFERQIDENHEEIGYVGIKCDIQIGDLKYNYIEIEYKQSRVTHILVQNQKVGEKNQARSGFDYISSQLAGIFGQPIADHGFGSSTDGCLYFKDKDNIIFNSYYWADSETRMYSIGCSDVRYYF